MTKNDAITMTKNSAMWKDITQDFKYWNEYMRYKNNDDAYDKLHLLTDDAVVKADINFTEIIVKSYGVFEIMKEIADDFGDDEVMCIIKDKEGEMRYRSLLYHILMNMLKEEFNEEMKDKEYSDSEEENDESDEEIEIESLDSFLKREWKKRNSECEESD